MVHRGIDDCMNQTKSAREFRELIGKYLEGRATEAEIRFLEMYYDAFENQENVLDGYDASQLQKIGTEIKEHVAARIQATEAAHTPVRRINRSRWVAAASIFLVLAAGIWFFQSRQENYNQSADADLLPEAADILPGGNRATLTLADGSAILLDSAHTGSIAYQGITSVIKRGEGQLSYQVGDEAGDMPAVWNTITTPRGGQYQVTLPDGSKVWLNAASSLTFPTAFSGSSRTVRMTGEVYFEVAKDAAKPFLVETGPMTVQVLGTRFNVNAYPDEQGIQTTLIEGAVSLGAAGKSATLQPGQQATFMPSTSRLKILSGVDTRHSVAWKDGYFIFDNAPLQGVMRQVARWYDIEVRYEGHFPPRQFVGEIQRNLSLTQMLEILNKNKVHYRISGKTLVLTSRE